MEVYRRRIGSFQGHSKGIANSIGVNYLEGDKEETPVTVSRCNEREDSPVSKILKMAVEVSNYAGLSCDGQEGLKEECLKQIVMEKYGAGGGSGT